MVVINDEELKKVKEGWEHVVGRSDAKIGKGLMEQIVKTIQLLTELQEKRRG